MRQVLGSLVAVLAAVSSAEAQEWKVLLTTEQAVYKKGSSEGVTITLKNEGSVSVVWYGPWSVWKDGWAVYEPTAFLGPILLKPGYSKTWNWNLKDGSGKAVPSGSYTIRVEAMWIDSPSFGVKRTIAVTPSGKLAGSNKFPLAAGNQWSYVSGPGLGGFASAPVWVTVTGKLGSWFWVQGLLGGDWYVKRTGTVYPTLYVKYQDKSAVLFRFNRWTGYSYEVSVPPLMGKKLRVGATKATVLTPVGEFKNCYRLDVVGQTGVGYKSFWFAPGVGLVAYDMYTPNEIVAYRLQTATVKGSDGKFYTISAAPY